MKESYWHQKWADNDIAFHENDGNPLLKRHFSLLNLAISSRVFIPLCGKTLDIAWLLSKGYQVVGAELSQFAVQELFKNLGIEPSVSKNGKFDHYQAVNLDIFVGDIFNLSTDIIGSVDAIYDRAALVALPVELRIKYTHHLIEITNKAPQLLICFEYDQSDMAGPPFSIKHENIQQYYSQDYAIKFIERKNVKGGIKGQTPGNEAVWLLQ
tara:strand:+ start:10938 stop:11570 length:633 start_codon:yes stop_codon:yes gene_type:complete